jgi:hypothetical protein
MDTLLDIMPFVALFYVAFQLGKHWGYFQLSQNMIRNPDGMITILNRVKELDLEEDVEKTGTEMSIERVGDMLYAYSKETNQFLGQAPDLNTLLENIQKRFPGKEFFGTISKEDSAKELVK